MGIVDEIDKTFASDSGGSDGEEGGEDELLEVPLSKKDLSEADRQVMEVKWEPSKGMYYAILYRKMVEVFAVEEEKPVSTAVFDIFASSMDFVGEN